MNTEMSSGSKGHHLNEGKGNTLAPEQSFKTPSQIFENFAEKVRYFNLSNLHDEYIVLHCQCK